MLEIDVIHEDRLKVSGKRNYGPRLVFFPCSPAGCRVGRSMGGGGDLPCAIDGWIDASAGRIGGATLADHVLHERLSWRSGDAAKPILGVVVA
jgi:hypothetical protein